MLLPIARTNGEKGRRIKTIDKPILFFMISAFNVRSDLPHACRRFRLTQFDEAVIDERQNI